MENNSKYGVLLFKHISLVLIILNTLFSFAQDQYHTQNGNVLITATLSDSLFKLRSNEVVIVLKTSKATFEITIDKSTFRNGNKRVDGELALIKSDKIILTGKLDINNINNYDHVPLDFGVSGIISTNNKTLNGIGRMEHISSEGNISCLLTLKFILSKDDLG